MFSKALTVAAAALTVLPSASAQYDPNKKTNLVMYWGQGSNQESLVEFCRNTPADIIPVGFVNVYPPAGNGYVGANYGNACWNTYYQGPGYMGKAPVPDQDLLPNFCRRVQDSIPQCQKLGKKILLSIGGGVPFLNPYTGAYDKTYKGMLTSAADGEYMANFLWGAYGPPDPAWQGPRPLDRGIDNATASITVDVDGFDFDIEDTIAGTQRLVGETAGYIAMINRLKVLAAAQTAKTGKKYIFSASPQCTLDPKEKNLDAMLWQAGFDMVFVQFYNQGPASCTARSRAGKVGAFNWNAWRAYLNQNGNKSNGAKIYIGLLGGPSGSAYAPGDFLNVAEVNNLISTYGRNEQLGGFMLWDATAAFNYRGSDLPKGQYYWNVVKNAMLYNFPNQKRDMEIHEAQIRNFDPVKFAGRDVDEPLELPAAPVRRHAHMARHKRHHS